MEEVEIQAQKLGGEVDKAVEKLGIASLEKEQASLKADSESKDFWQDQSAAQINLKQQASLETRIRQWRDLEKEVSDIIDLAKTNDSSLFEELETQLKGAQERFNELKEQLKFSGPYDSNDAIVSIYAGAGGTDAQDWAQMLERMYLRWAESNSFKGNILDESAGDEAGIKSVTFEVDGDLAYGQLKGEHGVHRLVRLSPFNADHLRQTSFAKVEVLPKIDKPDQLQLDDKDLRIDVYRSGGKGGQSVNTTDSAVRITHLPTNTVVAIQNERSQLQNKEKAMTILRSKLAQMQLEQHRDHLSELKGPNQSAEWGNQIRNYVLHPYKQVKDLRTGYETSDPDKVLDGDIEPFIKAYLDHNLAE